jgi:hypothetical protein
MQYYVLVGLVAVLVLIWAADRLGVPWDSMSVGIVGIDEVKIPTALLEEDQHLGALDPVPRPSFSWKTIDISLPDGRVRRWVTVSGELYERVQAGNFDAQVNVQVGRFFKYMRVRVIQILEPAAASVAKI